MNVHNKTLHHPKGCSPSAPSRKSDNLANDGEDIMPDTPTHGTHISLCALSFIPGGHVNPAVSLAMVILGKLKIWKFPFYVIAQFLGAFAGAAAVFGLYYGENTYLLHYMYIKAQKKLCIIYNNSLCVITDAFMDFTSGILSVTGINATGHIFASYPARHLSILGGFIDQVSFGHHGP